MSVPHKFFLIDVSMERTLLWAFYTRQQLAPFQAGLRLQRASPLINHMLLRAEEAAGQCCSNTRW